MADVAIFGAGGLGRLVCDILLQGGGGRPVAFVDSDPDQTGKVIDGIEVVGAIDALDALRARNVTGIVVAVGDNPVRVRLAEECRRRRFALISAIHPLASISPSARLGEHLIVGARATVCVHATVGAHSILSAGSIVEHDNVLGTGVMLHPAARLAGGVTVEEYASVGIGACVIPGRRIGRGAYVEPGAVVIREVPPGAIVGGVPARVRSARHSRFVADSPTRTLFPPHDPQVPQPAGRHS